jgi:hypothetical protein
MEKLFQYLDIHENRQKVILNMGRFSVIGGALVTLMLVIAILMK